LFQIVGSFLTFTFHKVGLVWCGWSRDATAWWLAAGSCGNRWHMGTGWACPRKRCTCPIYQTLSLPILSGRSLALSQH